MLHKVKKYQQPLVILLIILFMGIIMAGGMKYVSRLRQDLRNSSRESLLAVTAQQQQTFAAFIRDDQAQLHSFAEYFVHNGICDPEEVRQALTLADVTDAVYLVVCLDDGWSCSTWFDDIREVNEDDLATFRALGPSGARDPYLGLYSGIQRFSYYEAFTFSNGHMGLIQKSYDRTRVSDRFSLSFYNGEGLSYLVNQNGDILLRSAGAEGELYSNIFDQLAETHGSTSDTARLRRALSSQDTGSLTVSGEQGEFVYTYTPLGAIDGWSLVSVLPADAIRLENRKLLLEFQLALGLLVLLLFICAIFILMTWRTQRDLLVLDREVGYQTQLFDSFSAYFSGNTDDIYLILDHATDALEYVSPNVTRVLGIQPEDAISILEQQDLNADAKETETYYNEVVSLVPGTGTHPRMTERVNPVTGEHKFFREHAYCTLIQGTPKRVCCISDRTKERLSQNSLTEALHMAQAANNAKSAFLSSVSHDIRTPMNAIIGFLALMRDEVNDPAAVLEYNRRIDAASQHLLGLINDVLDMNKIESGSATLNLSEMDLADSIEEINTIIRPQAKAKNQAFEVTAACLRHERLLGDKLRINQILINLLSNAVKYTPDGGQIELRVEELPQVLDNYSRIRFTIRDNGMGMGEEYLKIIFEPFTREDTHAAQEIQGTGLGMAITKSLVDLMGGTIAVESTQGEGSTFTVELELCIQETEEDPKFWERHRISRMIVTDDDEDVCKHVVKLMSRAGVAADYATDGETAVRMMRETREAGRPYDLILLDWKMPRLDGLATARLIRQNYSKQIPILLLTAYDWGDIEQEALEIGIQHFLPKPFFMSTFKAAIQRVAGSQEAAKHPQDNVVSGMRILVVDDIEVNRIILTKILSSLGAACDTAENGQMAAERVGNSAPGRYDLILMDVQMPVMDGYAATRAIRASGHPDAARLPIIAMTANAFVEDVRDAIDSGMDAHVAKPVQVDMLQSTIREVLERRRQAE